MASCSLGISNVKFSRFDYGRARSVDLRQWNRIRVWIGRKDVQFAGLTTSYNEPKNMLRICCGPNLESEDATTKVTSIKDSKSSDLTSQLAPNSSEIEYLVTEICNTTNIAEFEMRLAGFELYVRRELPRKTKPPSLTAPAPAPLTAPVNIDTSTKTPGLNGSVSSTSLAISTAVPRQSFLDRAADEGLMILQSPRVGFFRRSRTIKGKRAPPSCKEKQIVKEGQVICYIEQLGGELPIESDVSGEVIKILREDGEPVGFGDALVAILPSFPGIKKLQ